MKKTDLEHSEMSNDDNDTLAQIYCWLLYRCLFICLCFKTGSCYVLLDGLKLAIETHIYIEPSASVLGSSTWLAYLMFLLLLDFIFKLVTVR